MPAAAVAKLATPELPRRPVISIVAALEPNADAPRTTLRIDVAGAPRTEPAPAPEERTRMERELDRVQHALQAEHAMFGQQLNCLILSQALLLNAWLIVLVLGRSTPLQGNRLLLAGLALFAALVAVLVALALRGGRDALHALRSQQRELEDALHRRFGRTPLFQSASVVSRGFGAAAMRLLPARFVAGRVAISLYTLAAPMSSKAIEEATASTATPARAVPRAATPGRAAAPRAAQPAAASATIENGAVATPNPAAPQRPGFKW